jgi:hypothetical protein
MERLLSQQPISQLTFFASRVEVLVVRELSRLVVEVPVACFIQPLKR